MFHGRGGRWERRLLLSGWRWRVRDLESAESDVPASVAECCAVLCCGLLHRAVAGAGEQQMLLPQRLNARSEERLTAEMTELGQASLRNPA